MPSSAHCHTAGMGRGHRQGLQQEGGIDSWQEPPTESGSWKMLVIGGIAQHPVGAWPAWPLHYPSSPQHDPFLPGWSSSWAIASNTSPASSQGRSLLLGLLLPPL